MKTKKPKKIWIDSCCLECGRPVSGYYVEGDDIYCESCLDGGDPDEYKNEMRREYADDPY